MFQILHRIEHKLDRLLERKDPMPAIDDLKSDLTAFFAAFDQFVANVTAALASASGSNDPAIMALDQTVKDEMAKLAAAAATVAPAPAPAPAAPAA